MENLDYDHLLSMQNKPIEVSHYYSNQQILLVGEGDFSFSSSLATQFGIANNIVATSLDSRDDLQKKYYIDAIENINNLIHRGARVFHGVNTCNMATERRRLLLGVGNSFYDVIIFNFPHAGFFGPEMDPKVIQRHKKLVLSFFKNASFMLSPGGLVYVSHKCGTPYDDWNMIEQAAMTGLECRRIAPFSSSDFPGYKNRRGAGSRAGEIFMLGKAGTYIFEIRDNVWIENIEEDPLQTHNKNDIILQISNLRSFKEKMIKNGLASSKTPLLQIIATEVARLETLKLGEKKQRKLNSLKLMLKVIHLVLETPLAVKKIASSQATSSCKRTMQYWLRIQRLALEVLKGAFEEQNIKLEKLGFGAFKDPERNTLLTELCVEQNMCDSMKNQCPYKQERELQVEEVLEIHVSDNIADEALLEPEGEENEESFSAFVQETQMPHSTNQDVMEFENIVLTAQKFEESNHMSTIDIADEALLEPEGEENEDSFSAFVRETQMPHSTNQDVMEFENIVLTGHKIEVSNHMSTTDQEDMYFQLEYQSSNENQSDMHSDEVFGVCNLSSEDVEGEDFLLESKCSFAERISNWISNYICSCF